MTKSNFDSLVCIIDDDAAVRGSMAAVVATLGCRVACFSTAEEYLAHPARVQADFLIVDVRLPGMSGLELLERLDGENVTLPVAVMTGHANAEELELSFWSGKLSVLSKPCHPERLLNAIADSLSTC